MTQWLSSAMANARIFYFIKRPLKKLLDRPIILEVRQFCPARPVHPDIHSFTDYILFRNKTPVTTVVTAITIVTHHKIHAFRYRPNTFCHETSQIFILTNLMSASVDGFVKQSIRLPSLRLATNCSSIFSPLMVSCLLM